MYKIYFVLLFLLSSCAIDFNHLRFYNNLNEEKQAYYKLTTFGSENKPEEKIYSINSSEFLSGIQNDTVNYKLIVFFTQWCPGSEAFLPGFVKDLKQHGNKPETYFISPDDWVYKYDYLDYAQKINLNNPVYLLDVCKYGEKKNPHYRMHKFISEICSNCEEVSGFPSLILFDRRNEVVYKHTGAVSIDTIVEVMKKTRNP